MIRLAIDTSSAPSSLALSLALEKPPSMIWRTLDKERSDAEHLVCQIKELMSEAQLGFDDLDEIIVARGPGPFMSLRIGLAAARGLGLAAKLPVKGASTLAAFASTAPREQNAIIVALAPSTMNRIVFQSFENDLTALSPINIAERLDFEKFLSNHKAQKIHLTCPAAFMSKKTVSTNACIKTNAKTKLMPIKNSLAEILLTLPAAQLSQPAEPLYPPA